MQLNCISAEMVRWYLGDRQWHTGMEIIEHFKGIIEPEKCSQFYFAKNGGLAKEFPMDAAVAAGLRAMVTVAIGPLVNKGSVEQIGGRTFDSRKLRWVAWHCKLCGALVTTQPDYPRHGFCKTCAIETGAEHGTESDNDGL